MPLKDPTSDMAVIARQGSKLVKVRGIVQYGLSLGCASVRVGLVPGALFTPAGLQAGQGAALLSSGLSRCPLRFQVGLVSSWASLSRPVGCGVAWHAAACAAWLPGWLAWPLTCALCSTSAHF